MTSRNGKQLQSFKGVTKILNFELRKILISINVPCEIRAYRCEKISEINKRTGTFIWYSIVEIVYHSKFQKDESLFLQKNVAFKLIPYQSYHLLRHIFINISVKLYLY